MNGNLGASSFLQLGNQGRGTLVSIFGAFGQQLEHSGLEARRNAYLELAGRSWFCLADAGDLLDERAALEGRPASQKGINGGTQAIEVGTSINVGNATGAFG